MKLNSLAPNAQYDLQHGRPAVLEADNDGSYLYRYNISEQFRVVEGKTDEEHVGWECCEIRIWETPSKTALKKAIIHSVLDEPAEFALVNSYNKHILGIKNNPTAVEEYKEFLLFTEELDALLTADLPL